MKFNLHKFKKLSSDKHSTTLIHPGGHKIVIAHKSLSPKMKAGLEALPGAEIGPDQRALPGAKIDSNENAKDTKPPVMLSKGGQADPTQRHLLPGDKMPNAIEKSVVDKARSKYADGGEVTDKEEQPDPTKEEMAKKYPQVPYTSWGDPTAWGTSNTSVNVPKPQKQGTVQNPREEQPETDGNAASQRHDDIISLASEGYKNMVRGLPQTPEQKAAAHAMAEMSLGAATGGIGQQAGAVAKSLAPEAKALLGDQAGVLRLQGAGRPSMGAIQKGQEAIGAATQSPTTVEAAQSQLKALQDLYTKAPSQRTAQQIQSMAQHVSRLSGRSGFAEGGEVEEPTDLQAELLKSVPGNPALAGGVSAAPGDVSELLPQDPYAVRPPSPDTEVASNPGAPAPMRAPAAEEMGPPAPKADAPVSQNPGAPAPAEAPVPAPDFLHGYESQQQGIQKVAQAEGAAARAQADVAGQAIADQQKIMAHFKTNYDQLDNERKAFQEDIQNSHINPQHYLQNQDMGQKIATAIGLALGGIGSGVTGGTNPALDFLNKQIDRDISAQQAELGKKESLLSANMRQFGNLRDASEMTRVMQTDIIANEFKKRAAMSSDPIVKARALEAAGQLEQQVAPAFLTLIMRQSLASADKSGADPASFVQYVVPEPERKQVAHEIGQAQNAKSNGEFIMKAFDKAAEENTILGRTGRLGFQPPSIKALDIMLLPLIHDAEGRVNQFEQDTARENYPMPGDRPSSQADKRKNMLQFINQKQAAPNAKVYGIDLKKFASTSPTVGPNPNEGKIASGPGGARLIMRNGQWTPYNGQ